MNAALEIIAGASSFTLIVVLLVSLVLLTRRWLVPDKQVCLTINGKPRTTTAGRNLLRALQDTGIFLPAACAGRGMCGQCKVTVVNPSFDALPTEMNHLTQREARSGVRLACANRIRTDLALQIPEQLLNIQKQVCTVRSANFVTPYLREIVLALPAGEHLSFAAGQFVLVDAPAHDLRFADFDVSESYRAVWDSAGLLSLQSCTDVATTRAYSLANSPKDDTEAMLVVRIALPPANSPPSTPPGLVSSFLFSLRPGDTLAVAGPFGHFRVSDSDREMILIAGGAGIAPMRSIILDQLEHRESGRKISFWYGVRSHQDLCYEAQFNALAARHDNFSWHVALSEVRRNDDWNGYTGFIHELVHERYLAEHPAPEEAEYYLCGPPVMSTAVTQMLEDLGVDRQSIFFDDFGTGS